MVILYVTIVILYSHIYRRCRHGYIFGAPYASGIRSIENLKINQVKRNQEALFIFRFGSERITWSPKSILTE